MSNAIEHTESSGNVFADLGLPQPEERLRSAIDAIMNQQSEKELAMSDGELEGLYRIEVQTPQQLGARDLFVVNFFTRDTPAGSPVVHVQLQASGGTLRCVNRPADADRTKYGALWDNKYIPLAQKHVAQQGAPAQEEALTAA